MCRCTHVLAAALLAGTAQAQGVSEDPSVVAPPPATAAGWQVCNQSNDDPVWVAYAIKEGEEWKVHGWREIAKGACSTLLAEINSRYLYYLADGKNKTSWSGGRLMCVHPTQEFVLSGAPGDCPAGTEKRGFVEVDTGSYKQYTSRLLP